MTKFLTLTRTEIQQYLRRPDTYYIIAVFYFSCGFSWFYIYRPFANHQLDLYEYFEFLALASCVVLPLLSQRSWTSEFRLRTIDVLAQLPLSFKTVSLAKFIAPLLIISVSYSFIILLALQISLLGDLDWGILLSSLVGLFFVQAIIILTSQLIGVFFRAPARSLLVAILVIMLIMYCDRVLLNFLLKFDISEPLQNKIYSLSPMFHFKHFIGGFIESQSIDYFLVSSYGLWVAIATQSRKNL
ncbi:MAG: hypothetical protein HRU19_18305 [Pseudobacteriovorax sp.]|nr:hypothetical protein [Pseudobacteriovorax sp.]